MRHAHSFLAISLAAMLGACTVGPNYVKPEIATPATFKEAQGWKAAEPKDELPRGKWWESFNDPVLNGLAEQVEVSNQNIRAAEAQFRQARALAQQARAGSYPTVSGSGSVTRSRSGGTSSTNTNISRTSTLYKLGLDASWEPDIWGKVQRSVESGNADVQASAADIAAAKLSAQAELAQDYFLLRVADERKKLLDDTVAAYEKSLQLTKNQYAVGVVARGDVVTAETQLKSAQAQAVDVGVQRAQLEHAIAVLIGKAPAEFTIAPVTFNLALPDIPVGVPSALLERRPDIAAAERRAASANAQIGVAQAAFYPDLTLSAAAGFQSASFAKWLTYPSRFWTLGPSLAQIIFDGGLRKAKTEQAIAAYDENVANYRQNVLTAFQEVEDNLSSLRILEEEARLQDEAVKAARESVAITTNQYKAGTVSYINVVNVQTIALTNERNALAILGNRLTAAVQLVKALGGGWNVSELDEVAQAPKAEH
ncbi:RND transporter [Novimethylophilus kurashikiensis]|uniref:RND transporter n=1 Tax=Novimethylophilus kurashikiensis TaxID=1825523 RepID=A0A2R5F881_9PROT|nr:efflux transporter outer membrane subunit [Novimethylophilus kurashikiensis]GBG13113.1 RND transporter [Novimethylophilus kurashikiensis]